MVKYAFYALLFVAGVIFFMTKNLGGGDMKTETDILLATDRQFSEYSVEHGAAAAFKKYLTEDALQLPAGANPILGRADIYQKMSASAGKYELRWQPQAAEVAESMDMGWSWGKYQFKSKDAEGKESIQHGKYLNIWKKDAEGNWRVAVDMGSGSPAPEK